MRIISGRPNAPAFARNTRSRNRAIRHRVRRLRESVRPPFERFRPSLTEPRSAQAHLWLGLALRKANRNTEARKELQKAVDLDPARARAKQQLAKTPEK
jgi:cell division septum initiation protein DivIVA